MNKQMYVFATGQNLRFLEESVNYLISQGYTPIGSVISHNEHGYGYIQQPMLLTDPIEVSRSKRIREEADERDKERLLEMINEMRGDE